MRWIGLIALFLLFTGMTNSKSTVTVVIDAGHGGSDPGHLSHIKSLKQEKEINLKIANLLGGYIKQYLGNVRVLYTRTDDRFVSLDGRVDLANNNNVDYFISIHCNGNPKKSVYGTETHVHNFQARQSYSLAKDIEAQFKGRAGRHSRGVKNNDDRAHSIQVLKFTKMTSVLVECGFITNTREANYLNGTYGQEIIASAIFRGFRSAVQRDFPSVNLDPSSKTGDYIVQIMSSKAPIDTNHESFRRLKMDVVREKMNTKNAYKYKYYLDPFANQTDAMDALSKARKRGFKDAILNKV